MRSVKKIISCLILSALVFCMMTSSFSAASNTPKEEVVYVNLASDGKVEEIYVVNIFETEVPGTVIDYGTYSQVRNMTSTEKINYSGDEITVNSNGEKVYYEGKLEDLNLPWNIDIRYYMDNIEYSAEEIAGKSGALTLKLNVSENTLFAGEFFDSHALQITMSLNTEKCKNIVADGATMANVGNKKQLTFTVLAGAGANIEVSADVSDFEMDGISINGISLNLNLDIDSSIFSDKISEILNAINSINSGASQLKDGVSQIQKGTETLDSKFGELNKGVGQLSQGAASLNDGLVAISSKSQELLDGAMTAFGGICTAVETVLNSQLSASCIPNVNLTPETYAQVFDGLLSQLDSESLYQKAYAEAEVQVKEKVEAQAGTLYKGYIESQAEAIYASYIESQAETLYNQVATSAVLAQYIEAGLTEELAKARLETVEGQADISVAYLTMTDEQKSQILATALASLTDEQKVQILDGAVKSLTSEQKETIKTAYVEQMMTTPEVVAQIEAAISQADTGVAQIVELKCQLDSYKAFYDGLSAYTSGVDSALAGAGELKIGLETLYTNTGKLDVSVGDLNSAVKQLYSGTEELASGAGEFESQTSGMDSVINDEIGSIMASIGGGSSDVSSFVSDKNTAVNAVQFVIKTPAVSAPEIESSDFDSEPELTFWQKFLKLFGLYKD